MLCGPVADARTLVGGAPAIESTVFNGPTVPMTG
jgi:hypothetical protein